MVERVRHIRKYEHRRAETAALHAGHGFGVNTSLYLVMKPFWAFVKTCGARFFVSLVMRCCISLYFRARNQIGYHLIQI